MNLNQFKSSFFPSPSLLHLHRLAISQKQLTEYWYSLSLTQIQQILSIHDQYLIHEIIFQQYLKYYINHKKISIGEVFYVMHNQKIYMYVYDAKIFRMQGYQKYDNDMISTFIIAYKEAQVQGNSNLDQNGNRININNNMKTQSQIINTQIDDNQDIFQFLNHKILQPGKWIFKVKQSAILRIFPYLIHKLINKRENTYTTNLRNPIGASYYSKDPDFPHEVVILQPESYFYYLYLKLPRHQYSPQMSIKTLFQTLLDLILNNFLIAWYSTLSQEQKYDRHFNRYFRLIPKPKNKEEFTSIQNRFTEISWQSFKVRMFKLKYKIKQQQEYYQCYQIQDEEGKVVNQMYQLEEGSQDWNILKAFNKQKQMSLGYDHDYGTFFDIQQIQARIRSQQQSLRLSALNNIYNTGNQ